MKTIWKYSLDTTDVQGLKIPIGGQILSIQAQGNTPCMWVLVDPNASKENRKFRTFGTGAPVEDNELDNSKFIGTYQLFGGSLIFHVFEIL